MLAGNQTRGYRSFWDLLFKSGMVLELIVLGLTPEWIVASGNDIQLSAYEKEGGDSGLHLFPSPASSHMCLLLPSAGSRAV